MFTSHMNSLKTKRNFFYTGIQIKIAFFVFFLLIYIKILKIYIYIKLDLYELILINVLSVFLLIVLKNKNFLNFLLVISKISTFYYL